MKPATLRLERVALKWRDLAERRRDHFIELYQSGRWARYYNSQDFLLEMRDAVLIADRWAVIAPRAEETAVPEDKIGSVALLPAA